MAGEFRTGVISITAKTATVIQLITGLLVIFWATVGAESLGFSMHATRATSGILLSTLVPGLLLVSVLDIETKSIGRTILFSVGLSVATLSLIAVILSALLPIVGISRPLSFVPLATVLTIIIVGWVTLNFYRDPGFSAFEITLNAPDPVVPFLISLPTLAAIAAISMSQFGTNVGMYLFVLAVGVTVLLVPTDVIPTRLYPATVFLLSLSTLLHRNLVVGHVVGADIQLEYFLAEHTHNVGQWSHEIGGSLAGLPLITSTPTVVSTLTGISHLHIFIMLYIFLFSLVPLGVFYLGQELFDENIAIFASLFFLFYHISFYFTPGKQQVSQLFVVLLLLLFFQGNHRRTERQIAVSLLTIALVFSHYGTAYMYGISALIAAVGLLVIDRIGGDIRYELSPVYPITALAGATVWYGITTPDLIAQLLEIPFGLLRQIGGTVEGSGASAVQQQTSLLEELTLYLYLLFTALICLGLAWQVLIGFVRIARNKQPPYVEYTALAVPLFVFLGSSYVVILNLWAARVYQLVLIVLALSMSFGYDLVNRGLDAIRRHLASLIDGGFKADRRRSGARWALLAILLVSLFSLNSGMAFAVAGESSDYTFDKDSHDYAFTQEERAGGTWIKAYSGVESTAGGPPTGPPDDTRIYTDPYSYQMLRSIIPPGAYTTDIVLYKSRWRPTFDSSEITDGYALIRHRSIVETSGSTPVATSRLSRANKNELHRSGNAVYTNGETTIVRVTNSTGNESSADVSTLQ